MGIGPTELYPGQPRLSPDCIRRGGWRLAALAFFGHGIYGCYLPYLALFFSRALDFTDGQVGALMMLASLMRIISSPVWGAASDATKQPRLLIAGALVPALVALLLMSAGPAFPLMVVLMALFAFFFSPTVPMIDGATFKYVQRTGGDYPRIRMWGSLGFIVFAIAAGLPMYYWPQRWWFFVVAVPVGAMACYCALRIPDCPPRRPGKVGLRGFIMFKRFPVAVITLCSFLSWTAMGAYYGFFSHYLRSQGVAACWIGAIWALGTLSETYLMYHSRWVLSRIGVKGMFGVGLGGVVLRLGLLSQLPSWPVMIGSQVLHALTFTAVHVSAVSYINAESPDHLRSSAQGIFSMIGPGLGLAAGSLLAGQFRGAFGQVVMLQIHAVLALAALAILLLFFHARSNGYDAEKAREQ